MNEIDPAPSKSAFLSPTDPGDIQVIQDALRASLSQANSGPGGVLKKTPLREIDPSGLSAHVHWPLTGRTLGSDRGFRFDTAELTAHALHVRCVAFDRTFFTPGATIVQARLFIPSVLVTGSGTPVDFIPVDFLGKVVKEVPAIEGTDEGGNATDAGFLLQVVQMSHGNTIALTELLARLRADAGAQSENLP